MRILIVAATEFEVEPLISDFGFQISDLVNGELPIANHQLLITKPGMVPTAFALGKHLATNHYDLAINLGICGSFERNIPLGTVLEITEDTFAELGAEDDEKFISIAELGFGQGAFSSTYSLPADAGIQKATAITVNTVHGNEASIQKISNRINAQLESMEGAAFFYACRQMNVPCLQIRAVSNYVEKRNSAAWQIGLAIKNLNKFAAELLTKLAAV